jgi:hypothetical protein
LNESLAGVKRVILQDFRFTDKMVSDFKSLTEGVGMFCSRMEVVKLQPPLTVKLQLHLTVELNHL